MRATIQVADLALDVVLKDIKNIHLSVHPPSGAVTVSAPSHLSLDSIRVFAISKLGWIRKQQTKIHSQEREPPRRYLDRESHYVWGRRYLLKLSEVEQPPIVELKHTRMHLSVRPGTDVAKRHSILEGWYRAQLRQAAPPLIAKWETTLGVAVDRFFVQRMKTKWGSCNCRRRTIRLNTDLAKKPPECLEYLIVHEMTHLLEPTHNARFVEVMDQFLPRWRSHRQTLNRLPVRHEGWAY